VDNAVNAEAINTRLIHHDSISKGVSVKVMASAVIIY
jgi:hypothetical protein